MDLNLVKVTIKSREFIMPSLELQGHMKCNLSAATWQWTAVRTKPGNHLKSESGRRQFQSERSASSSPTDGWLPLWTFLPRMWLHGGGCRFSSGRKSHSIIWGGVCLLANLTSHQHSPRGCRRKWEECSLVSVLRMIEGQLPGLGTRQFSSPTPTPATTTPVCLLNAFLSPK